MQAIPKKTVRTAALLVAAALLCGGAQRSGAEDQAWGPATPDLVAGPWLVEGPGPSHNGQLEGIPNKPVTGAVNALAAHPTNADILYLGAVNGGLWRTDNATAAQPVWTAQSDALGSLSIGRDALQFDPTDASGNTLVAGIGRSSSFGSAGGARMGLLRTTNGGTTWAVLDGGGTLVGKNASGVAARGGVLMMSVNNSNGATDLNNIGIYRSTDTGATFVRVSGSGGLPLGRTFDLAADPVVGTTFYTTVRDAGASNGVYKSTDTGASWARVSDAAMNALISDTAPSTSNVKISVGIADNVFAAICNAGVLAGLFRSGNGGATWTSLDLPNPTIHPGGQASIHLSLVASRANPNVVFVGGDRQSLPSDIGAVDFSGRLFRVDASLPPGSQAQHLTHSSALGPPGGGTANNSAPHADSRIMVWDASGEVIEGDDGGVYRRTIPATDAGIWLSVIGNLVGTEFHDAAFDTNTNTIFGGSQDNGTPQQQIADNQLWVSVSTADGGDVSVDDQTTPGFSVRYSSFQNLGAFRRRTYDASNNLVLTQIPLLNVISGAPLQAQFVTPVKVNDLPGAGMRLIIGGANGAYESVNRGDSLVQLSTTNVKLNCIAYGGRRLGVDNPDALYVGSGSAVLVRTVSGGSLSPSAYPGGSVIGLAMNAVDWQEAVVADTGGQVYRTTNAGVTWANITHNLAGFNPGALRSVSFVPLGPGGALVGTDRGVFLLKLDTTTWTALGTALPNAPVFELDYDAARDKLTAGLLGRGTWLLTPVAPDVPVELLSFEITH